MPKVSVIIPIYGVEKFIERCARSLFEQTLDDIEYIFVNDCTPDRSMEILQEVIEDYPERKQQIRIEKMPTNSGIAAVRRYGMQLASGDYIIYCDSDDYIDRDMFEKMYGKVLETSADIVMVDIYKEFQDCRYLVKAPYSVDKNKILSSFIRGFSIYQWNKLIRKTLYLSFQSNLKDGHDMSEDYSIIVPLSFEANKIEYIPNTYYHYIQYNDSAITKRKIAQKEINGWIHSIICITEHLKQKNITGYEKDIMYRKLIVKYWCMLKTKGKLQKEISNLYPEINRHSKYLIQQFSGRRTKLLFYIVLKGYTNYFNLLLKLRIIKAI